MIMLLSYLIKNVEILELINCQKKLTKGHFQNIQKDKFSVVFLSKPAGYYPLSLW